MKKGYEKLNVTVIVMKKEDVISTSSKPQSQGTVLIPDWTV